MSFYPVSALSLILCFATWHAVAQVSTFTSVIAAGGTNDSVANALAIDGAGNTYVAGSFGRAHFGGKLDLGTTNLINLGETDGFVAKFDAQGECLWARQIAGIDADDAYDVVVRSDGTILVTGEFIGTNAIGSTQLIGQGGYDIFLAAFNSSGTLLWARAIGGTLDEFAIALAPGVDGATFFTGSFIGDINLGNGISFSAPDDDALLIKFDVGGIAQWARTGGGPGFQLGSDIKLDAQGNVLWAGEFETNILFTGASLTSSNLNVFLAKYDNAGNRQWIRKLGEGEDGADLPRIAIAPDGRMVCTAVYSGDYQIAGQTLPTGLDDILVASFGAAGDLQWVSTFGGFQLDVCTELLMDASGACHLAGHFRGIMAVGNTNLTSTGVSDVFVVRCSPSGELQGAVRAGSFGPDVALSGAMTASGNFRLAGSFAGTVQFGSISVTSSDGLPKAFIATLRPAPALRITPYPTHVLLSWPANYPEFALESKSQLSAPSWNPVLTTPVLVNGEFVVTNQGASPAQFFRLSD